MRRNRVVWGSSADPAIFARPPRRTPRAARFCRAVRTGALLAVIGVLRMAGNPAWRCAVLGAAITVPGLLLRDLAGNIMLLPGLLILFFAPFMPGGPRQSRARRTRLCRELAAYSTPSQRRDLEAIFDQYPDGETGELRAILAGQALRAAEALMSGAGHY